MIIDCLIKEKHYILYTMNDNCTTIKAVAKLLLNYIWKFYGLFLLLSLDKSF